jgi:hypothetical protein
MSEHFSLHPAFAVTARSGLTKGSATSWRQALPRGPRLLVPVDVRALVVRGGDPADHAAVGVRLLEQPPGGGTAGGPARRAAAPFTDEPARDPGVYLHWALPDGLTQGRATGAGGAARWRPLPNRWLVVRLAYGMPRPVTAWVIEADRGRHLPLDTWREEAAASGGRTPQLAAEDLTAVVGGDPAWAAVYDSVEDRFAFHDDLTGLTGSPTQPLAYVVVGWYSRADLDPLGDPAATLAADDPDAEAGGGAEAFQRLLARLGWSVDAERLAAAQAAAEGAGAATALVGLEPAAQAVKETDFGRLLDGAAGVASSARPWWPTQSVYHGVIYGVRPQRGPQEPPDPRPTRAAVRPALGATAAEGLAALVAAGLSDPDAELLQAMFNYGLADALGEPDGVPRVEEELHARAFVAKPGGERVERILAGDPFAGVRPTTPPTPAADATLAAHPDRTVKFAFAGGGGEVADLHTLLTRPDRAEPPPDPRRLEQVTRPLPRWFAPQDPVVVVGGLRRSLRHGYDGRFSPDERLACRLTGDTVTRIAGLYDGYELLERRIEHGGVPDEAGALVAEAALEDPFGDYVNLVERLGGRANVLPNAFLDVVQAEAKLLLWSLARPGQAAGLHALSLKDGVGASPAGITIWRQAWVPLFLEWELELDLGGRLDGWTLDELDHEPPQGAAIDPARVRVLAGRSLLVSASARTLADQVSAFLAEEQRLDEAGKGRIDDQLAARLRALGDEAGRADLLAAGLDGLRERLLGFDSDTAHDPGGGEPGPVVPSGAPLPLRAGLARLRRLRVVDAFGRALSLVEQAAPAPVVAAGLRAATVTATDGTAVLRPRVNQPSRLLLRLVDATDDSREATIDQAAGAPASPLAGWLLADHADGAVELFAADGTPLGQLAHDGLSGAVVWEGPPGARGPVGARPADAFGADPAHRHLHRLVDAMLERDAVERDAVARGLLPARSDTPLEALLRVVDTTAATVGLGGATGSEHLAQLIGKPIAVVRAALRLEVEPEAAFPTLGAAAQAARDEAWAALARQAFPVRLGALTRLDDGLLGFFADDDYARLHPVHASVRTLATPSGRHRGDFGPATDGGGGGGPRPIDVPYVVADPALRARPGQAIRLTLLMDPAGKVNATCGILPRKAVGLLRDWVGEALARVVPSLRVGPVLVDPATVRMPLPAAPGRDKAWTRRQTTTTWQDDPIVAATQQALLPETPAMLQEGYLRVTLEEEPP